MKIILGLMFFISSLSNAQSGISASYLKLNPTALPTVCSKGTTRFDSSGHKLNLCYPDNTWTAVGSSSSTLPVTTKGDLIGYSSSAVRVPIGATTGYLLTVDPGSTVGVSWASPPVSSPLTTKGDLGAWSSSNVRFPIGSTTGSFLVVDPGATVGFSWANILASQVPTLNQNTTGTANNVSGVVALINGGTGVAAGSTTAAFNSISPVAKKGDILGFSTQNVRFPIGATTGSFLVVDPGSTVGWSWANILASQVPTLNQNTTGTAANITASSNSTLTTLSTLSLPGGQVSGNISGNAANITGVVALANGGFGVNSGSTTAAFNVISPIAKKGDLLGFSTQNVKVPVGATTGYILTVNPGSTVGWDWEPSSGGLSTLTTKGDILTFSSSNVRHAVPGDYGWLLADSQQADGWRSVPYSQIIPKNYIQYADFENNSTTGWTLGNIPTITNGLPVSTSPTFGSGASGNLSLAIASSSQLAGSNSLSYVSSAATTKGDMVASSAITIDAEDQAKVLTVKFYYKDFSGTINASGTSSNSYGWAIWDATNSVWLNTAGQFCMTQTTGIGYCTGTFQTGSSTASVRLAIYNANATSGSATMYFDDIYMGPLPSVTGPAMGDWISYTPTFTGFGSPTNVDFYYKRIGDSIQIMGTLTPGTVTAVTAQISGPPGIVLNTSGLAQIKQIGSFNIGSAVAYMGCVLISSGFSNLTFGLGGDSTNNCLTQGTGSALFGASQMTLFTTPIPVVGWSSNSSMSSDTDTRVVTAKFGVDPTTTGTLSVTAATPVIFPYVYYDTHGAYNASTGVYTCPVTGYYNISTTAFYTTNSQNDFFLIQAGTVVSGRLGSNVGSNFDSQITQILCKAGDQLSLQGDSNAGLSYAALSAGPAGIIPTVTISRLSGPAVVAATESVNARYTTPTTTLAAGVVANIKYGTKSKDTHNAMSPNGWFVAPVSGEYLINAGLSVGGTWALNSGSDLFIYQNNAIQAGNDVWVAGVVRGVKNTITSSLTLAAGDTVGIYYNGNPTSPLIIGPSTNNYFSIIRVGN